MPDRFTAKTYVYSFLHRLRRDAAEITSCVLHSSDFTGVLF